MIDRRDAEHWRDLADRKKARDAEFLAGKIGEPTYLRSLMIYGFLEKDARIELGHLKDQQNEASDSRRRA